MRLTKFGHSCVRIEHDGTTLVLDPGVFTDAGAVDGADAVLITHEHPDHFHPDHLRRTDAPIFTIAAVAAQIREQRARPGRAGDGRRSRARTSTPAAIPVTAVGELHAVIHPELPRFDNSGYLLTPRRRHGLPPGGRARPGRAGRSTYSSPRCARRG